MISVKEHIAQELDNLSETELQEMAEYLAFLKFRARIPETLKLEEQQISALYAEFAEEDCRLAEEGLADYSAGLRDEDLR